MSDESTAARPLVRCHAGQFRGRIENGAASWKGIRYARAPIGALRWRAPQPAPAVAADAVAADAVAFGSAAPQPASRAMALGVGTRIGEDCLFLNIWRPHEHADEPLPVLVWVHGGAYFVGAGSQPLYDGAVLARTQGIVVVTLNYRLGPLGFLELGALPGREGDFDGNLGLRDVILALQWVRENIAAFGGDPKRVTIAGESSGAGIVAALLTCEPARGLFARAIMQSAPTASMYGPERARSAAERFLRHLGVPDADGDTLRRIPARELVSAGALLYRETPSTQPGTLAFAPAVDGVLLRQAPVAALSQGRGAPIPLLIGSNADEATAFRLMRSPVVPLAEPQLRRMFENILKEQPEIALPGPERLRESYAGSPTQRGLHLARDLAFRLPAVWVAEGHSRTASTWLYRFDHAASMLRLLGLGASHGTELPYVWGRLRLSPTDPTFWFGGRRAGHEVSARVQSRWGAFIRGGSPDAAGAPAWPEFATGRASLVIGRTDRTATDLDASLRHTWGDAVFAFR